jgi:hypothetical protein
MEIEAIWVNRSYRGKMLSDFTSGASKELFHDKTRGLKYRELFLSLLHTYIDLLSLR